MPEQKINYLANAGSNMINAGWNNGWGYLASGFFNAKAALVVGGLGTMVGVSLVGGAALYLPMLALKTSLYYMGLMSDLMHLTLGCAFYVGSAALGAVLFGLAVKPFVLCALVGIVVNACISSIFSTQSSTASASAPSAPAREERPNGRSGFFTSANDAHDEIDFNPAFPTMGTVS